MNVIGSSSTYHRQGNYIADDNISSRYSLLVAITNNGSIFGDETSNRLHDPRRVKIDHGIEGGRDNDNEQL